MSKLLSTILNAYGGGCIWRHTVYLLSDAVLYDRCLGEVADMVWGVCVDHALEVRITDLHG